MIGLNNPFNIRSNRRNKWIGQSGSTRGFCNFISLDYGVRAACYLLLKSYRRKGVVYLSDIINRFAPPSENDTFKYIAFLHDHSVPDFLTSKSDYVLALTNMSIYEGNPVTPDLIFHVIDRFELWK